ncbi:MAG: HPr family phosphocarrier protein [Elusimicrobiota bacterium]
MEKCKIKIVNKLGLHARPAAMFVQTTSKFKSKIKVIKDDQEVDGKSIMGLLMLAAEFGSELVVKAEGPDEKQVVEAVQKLIMNKFEEE